MRLNLLPGHSLSTVTSSIVGICEAKTRHLFVSLFEHLRV